jgi:hypothetical protein
MKPISKLVSAIALRSSSSKLIIVVFSLVLALVLVPAASADDEEGCSIATLRGNYGIQSTGSIVAAGPIGLVAEAGIIKFDGQGGASQTTTVSLNGTILHNRASLSGDYRVHPDCTGDLTLVLPGATGPIMSTSDFVIVDHGKEVRLVNTGAGRVIAGDARKQ